MTVERTVEPMKRIPVDLRKDGLLWLINAAVFHPRGFSLGIHVPSGDFVLIGNGDEPWNDGDASNEEIDALFSAAEATFGRARKANR